MRTHENVSRGALLAAIFAAAAFASTAPSVGWAQQTSQPSQLDARWQPWLGCWRPAAPPSAGPISYSEPRTADAPLVCVIPASGADASSSVNVVTIKDGKVVARDTVTATGQSIARSKQGCDGVERAKWSNDGQRLYLSSDFTCPGGLKRTSSGLFAISPAGQWVSVQAVNASGNKGVQTVHYSDAGMPGTVPAEISQTLNNRGFSVNTARAAAGARLATSDVVEASHNVDSAAVEAWIVDRGQSFGVDADQLVALADAGVPSNVTDGMVAVSYPKAFALNSPRDESGAAVAGEQDASGVELAQPAGGRNVEVFMAPSYASFGYAPFGFSPFDYYGYGYAPYGYSSFGYSPYGGYFSPYAGYSAGYGGLYWNRPAPVIVLKGQQPTRGYAVKGQGYTQRAPRSGSSTARQRPTQPQSSTRGANPSARPQQQPASSGRTAHRRP